VNAGFLRCLLQSQLTVAQKGGDLDSEPLAGEESIQPSLAYKGISPSHLLHALDNNGVDSIIMQIDLTTESGKRLPERYFQSKNSVFPHMLFSN